VDKAFDTLAEALEARKRVTFTYHSLNSRTTTPRTVEPYGLFFLGHAWYLAGSEVNREQETGHRDVVVKNFRLSRMSDVSCNRRQPGTPDYEIPATFNLREHARSREAWQLGSADVFVAVVEVTNHTGAARALTRLGEPVDGAPAHRTFRVRRMDTFARWLLGFAGSATPLSPPALVERYHAIARETFALYHGAA
jgi:predicted DNA-binding transcriptional regulator YafY